MGYQSSCGALKTRHAFLHKHKPPRDSQISEGTQREEVHLRRWRHESMTQKLLLLMFLHLNPQTLRPGEVLVTKIES